MALEKILLDGSENGASAAAKINAAIDEINLLSDHKTPKGAMSLSAPTVHDLNDTDYVIADFDINVTSRGGLEVNLVSNAITVGSTENYEANFSIDCDFSNKEELVIAFFINGVIMETTPFSLQGGGDGKPNSIAWTTTVPLEAGDVIDMRFKNGDAGNFDANIRRMYFAIKLDE